jgi:steroid delta-isomerase
MPDLSRSPEHIRAVMERYAVLMQAADADAIAMLFAEDAVVEDPVGTPPHVGRDAIRAFFKTGFDNTGGGMNFVWDGPVRVADKWGAAAATVKLEKYGGDKASADRLRLEADDRGDIAELKDEGFDLRGAATIVNDVIRAIEDRGWEVPLAPGRMY